MLWQEQAKIHVNSGTEVGLFFNAFTPQLHAKGFYRWVVLAWYHAHGLTVQPVTPSRPSIRVGSTAYNTVPSPAELPSPSETSLSIITQPYITLQVLKNAKEAGIPAVWLQPGSFDQEGLEYAVREFNAGIGGPGGGGGEGWCVLVDGEDAMSRAKEAQKEKL